MFKRITPSLIMFLISLLIMSGTALASPKVILDSKNISFDVPPMIENGSTLVPLRVIFTALGAEVNYDNATQTITATKVSTTIKLKLGSKTAYKNNNVVNLSVPAKSINGRTLVPLRFVSEALGAGVSYDANSKTVTINSNGVVAKNQPAPSTYKVIRVIDGDTIEIDFNEKKESVRLIGVDTPETVHPTVGVEPYGKEASNFTKSQLTGKNVRLEFDVQQRDKYGRLLAYVWVGNELFNEKLLGDGYAQILTIPPNVKYVDRFTVAQNQARTASIGLWGLGVQVAQNNPPKPAPTGKLIKGNISSSGEKIYHVPGGAYYDRTIAEYWFATEQEAKAAGYRPSKR